MSRSVSILMSPSTTTVRKTYDQLASRYDRRWRHYVEESLRATVEAIEARGDERVLDLACGTGELEWRLLDRWPSLRIVGADLSRGMLAEASPKPSGTAVGWVQASADRLPMADASFDLVVCSSSFHYFPRPRAALREVFRVVRPGGRFVLVDWCDDFLSCKACGLWLRLTDPAYLQTYRLDECLEMLAGAGFETVRSDRFKIDWLWGLMRVVCRRPAG